VLWISSDFEELLGICDRVIVISDGRSVADLACRALDVEKLMMFAAPKTSSNVLSVLLEQLSARFGGSAFWVYLDEPRVYCFDSATASGAAPLLERGTVLNLDQLPFGGALRASEEGFTIDAEGRHRILTISLATKRGHYFGHFGLAIPSGSAAPPREEIVGMVRGAMENL